MHEHRLIDAFFSNSAEKVKGWILSLNGFLLRVVAVSVCCCNVVLDLLDLGQKLLKFSNALLIRLHFYQSKLIDQVPHMAPSNTRRSTGYKRKQVVSESRDLPCTHRITTSTSPEESSCTIDDDQESDGDIIVGCSTPKAQRFRIPEILSCPPAPMKRRVTTKCSSKESPRVFFAPPDIELFFLFAFHKNIPA
ncbi:hypothetical protein SADUNF_Sadunf16G0047800 [Salix dunnii]|uniref:Uncharacterized protein n=1 Tax=Salix dunnii TaxID=1413687 RepID=A0A835J714_9ROSI|nr:hypothetical protein SADUNF_Sadunf16G0047800 [Salix dunnii]